MPALRLRVKTYHVNPPDTSGQEDCEDPDRLSSTPMARLSGALCPVILVVLILPYLHGLYAPSPTDGVLHGRVVTSDGTPVEGALVRIKGTAWVTRTRADGSFVLRPGETLTAPVRVTAAKEGYYIAGADWTGSSPVLFKLEPVPEGIDPRYEWVDPTPSRVNPLACANCHQQIYSEWVTSAHAQSAVNRRFLDVFYGKAVDPHRTPRWSLVRDRPDGRGVCAPCHIPQAVFWSPALDEPEKTTGAEREGVHCDVCHKIRDVAVAVFGLRHGSHAYEFVLPPPPRQVFFGPLDDVDRREDAYAPVFKDARFCAPCHEGVVLGAHAYTTYSEWQSSPAAKQGKTCQSCHMAPDGRKRNIAPGHGGIDRPPSTLSTHRFEGRSLEMLRNALTMEVTTRRGADSALRVDVTIRTSDVGHRVPTGFPQRHLVLAVMAIDQDGGALELLEGPVLPSFAGPSATLRRNLAGTPGAFYGRLLSADKDERPVAYWNATRTVADTRLLPEARRTETFRFLITDNEPCEVRCVLLYRPFFPELEQEKGWPPAETVVYSTTVTIP